MSEILGWGEYDEPYKNDFTSSKGAFTEKYKINKMGVHFISEKQDNFRNHLESQTVPKEDRIVDYLQNEAQHLTRKKMYRNTLEKELMKDFSTFTTEYREQMLKNATMVDSKKVFRKDKDEAKMNNAEAVARHKFYSEVTTAGKPRYLEIPKTGIKMPQELH